MKRHLILFVIIFILTLAVPVAVCITIDNRETDKAVIGIFRNIETTEASIPCVFGDFLKTDSDIGIYLR